MSTDRANQAATAPDHEAAATAGGEGRLARLLETRGGTAAPEASFVIEHREALIYMLCQAAELEHGIMCQYLFAAFSLKESEDEGLTPEELAAVTRWQRQILSVAAGEMLHLALVHNLLSAIGAAPHLSRPNLPAPAGHYPAGVQLALLPFGDQALRHFMFLERPEGMDLQDAAGLAAMQTAMPSVNPRDIVPTGQDFATVGHLYRSVEAGFRHLTEKYGEDWLFTGPPGAQATPALFGWPNLLPVTGLDSACAAVEEIVEQGEGPRGHWRDAHFGQFVAILDEYEQMREANPGFEPARPVLAANVRPHDRAGAVPVITDPLTARVTDLFNVNYEILLQLFERFFAHTTETDAQLKVLADASVALMVQVIKPLGSLITTLPPGPAYPGRTAGPSFELFYESDYLMPHQHAAWALLAERLDTAAWLCSELCAGRGTAVAAQLEPVLGAIRQIAAALAAHLGAAARRPPWRRLGRGCWPPTSTPWPSRPPGSWTACPPARKPPREARPRGRSRTAQPRPATSRAPGAAPRPGILRPPPRPGRLREAVLAATRLRAARPVRQLPCRAHRSGRGPAGRAAPGRAPQSGTGVARRSPAGAVRPAAVDPGRPQRPLPGHERAHGPQPPGAHHPGGTAARAVPLRRLRGQARLRRDLPRERVQRRERPRPGPRPPRHLPRPAGDRVRQPRHLPALRLLHRPAANGFPIR